MGKESTVDEVKQMFISIGSNFLAFAAVLVIGALIAKLILMVIKRFLVKTKGEKTAKTFIYSVLRITLYTITAVSALVAAGVDVGPIVTALGAVSITAGLALQSTLSNLFSGVTILFTKPFVANDLIEFEGYTGYVDHISIFFTTLHTFDNRIVKIPNSKLTSDNVVNCSAGENRRVDLCYTISYNDNINKAKSVVYDVIASCPKVISEPESKVVVGKHLDSGVEILAYVWANHKDYFDVYFYMQENVKKAFDENKITIPFPHVQIADSKIIENTSEVKTKR